VDRCYFCKETPEIEIAGGLAYIRPIGSKCEIAITPNVLDLFAARAREALALWRVDQIGKVSTLPRH